MEEDQISFKTIHLNEVKKMLGIEGVGFRTVIKWCKKNGITVFGVGKRRRILERDWNNNQKVKLIEELINTGGNWRKSLIDLGISEREIQNYEDAFFQEKSTVASRFLDKPEGGQV